jgi:rare lipoprotein A
MEDDAAASKVDAETGLASWYGSKFHRRKTASGERFDMYAMTAAHRTLAFGTLICVRSQITGRAVVVRVNDRGPHLPGRIVDLSHAAATELGLQGLGLKPVAVTPLAKGETSCPDDSPELAPD